MIVGELRHGQLTIIDRLRETVRLSEGLKKSGDLSVDARQRALSCLSRFGERLHDMKAASVRAAGTSTLRRARDSKSFREEAEQERADECPYDRARKRTPDVANFLGDVDHVLNGIRHAM